jgi:4-hydroxy-tetrahydrodipicolinate synthase
VNNQDPSRWSGNFCAVVTPFDEDGGLDLDAFGDNLQLLLSEGIEGVVVAGHTGESWAIEDDERAELFRVARDAVAERKPVIGAVSAIRTEDACRLARMAERAGIDGLLLTAPAYAMVDEREITEHVRQVGSATALPIMLYNIPRRIGRALTPDLVEALCDVPTVAALKQSSPAFDELSEVLDRCGDRLRVFAGGSAMRGIAAASVGAHGFVSSTETQVLGAEAIAIYERVQAGEAAAVRDVQRRCARLSTGLHRVGTEPAGLKVAMNLIGRPGGHPRRPLLPLASADVDEVRRLLDEVVPLDSSARRVAPAR